MEKSADPNQIATKIQDYVTVFWESDMGLSSQMIATVADGKGDLPSSDQSGRMKEFFESA